MSRIVKVIFEDGSEIEYKEQPLEAFSEHWNPGWLFRKQHHEWEEYAILSRLQTNLKTWAKDQYDLVEDDELNTIEDFSDWEIQREFQNRALKLNLIFNESIISEDFISRIVRIAELGDACEIDKTLELLEKAYRIK